MTLGKRLEELRTQHGWSRRYVSEQIGISTESYRDIEYHSSSRHLLKILPALSKLFGVSIASLIGAKGKTSTAIEYAEQIKVLADKIIEESF